MTDQATPRQPTYKDAIDRAQVDWLGVPATLLCVRRDGGRAKIRTSSGGTQRHSWVPVTELTIQEDHPMSTAAFTQARRTPPTLSCRYGVTTIQTPRGDRFVGLADSGTGSTIVHTADPTPRYTAAERQGRNVARLIVDLLDSLARCTVPRRNGLPAHTCTDHPALVCDRCQIDEARNQVASEVP